MSTEVLSKRIQSLERVVLGSDESSKGSIHPPAVPFLNDFARDLGNAVDKRDRVRGVLRDVSSLNTYLDPSFGEEKGLPLNAKADILLSQSESIHKTNDLLERLHKSKGVLDRSQELERAVKEFEPKFNKLAQLQVDQENEAQEISKESLELMQKYNEIIEIVSKSFIQYDNILSKAEGK
uniref:Dynactin subunit 3 n=1 Tax=Caligus rogercresseyi TaxID=217165 RepID=C1BNV1_CALRO|nr:Dynactin subunit 3 [Caligus rogercresseyi]